MGVNSDNKAVLQEYRYIKIPDRRLISGLLYINVVSHNQNDDKNDFNQQVHKVNSAGSLDNEIKYSDTFTGDDNTQPPAPPPFPKFQGTKDRGREGMKHSFADYDCFVFHVAGGMSLSGGISLPSSGATQYSGVAALKAAGYVTGTGTLGDPYIWAVGSQPLSTSSPNELTSRWWEDSGGQSNPIGDSCSHFVKYHLLSRINNASGHGLAGETYTNGGSTTEHPFYAKHRPIIQQTYINPDGDKNRISPAQITNLAVLSHGLYADTDSIGNDLGTQSYATVGKGKDSTGGTNEGFTRIDGSVTRSTGEVQAQDEDGTLSPTDGNTYFSPVDTIKIYGQHRLVFDRHVHPTSGNRIFSHEGKNSIHVQDFWDLVIDIGLRGNNPSGASSFGTPDKSLVKPQINIMFQPFGETAEFDVSETAHTS
tara:strand:- start:15330 stop:16598 length:1269 start_codon:yes stop_codon:yes gene_type:complete